MDERRPPPPPCLSLLITGDEGERYKGPQEMLLRNDQYVLLCNVTGHVAQPFDPFQEPQGQYSWDGLLPQAGRVGAALLL